MMYQYTLVCMVNTDESPMAWSQQRDGMFMWCPGGVPEVVSHGLQSPFLAHGL